ncbi:MAG: diguanylate cyclase [Myxococcales bacterium]|nr:diguanylate cyclase [Myxococcales bacterium]
MRGSDEALAALRRENADLLIADLSLRGSNGLDLLAKVRREHPGCDVLIVTTNASVESAVGALRMGAADYLRKPVTSEELSLAVDRVQAKRRLLEENVRLRDALQTVESCKALTDCLDPGEVYTVALELLLHALWKKRGLAVFNRSYQAMPDAAAFRGFSESQAVRLRELLVGEKPVSVSSIPEIDEWTSGALFDAFASAGVETDRVLTVPVRGQESDAGVLWVLGDGGRFEDGDFERAMIVAGHAAASLDNAVRYSQAKAKAFIDDVTELHNARYLHHQIEHELRRADRYQSPMSILFLDLDHFKHVNDECGHLVGSRALKDLGRVLSACVREVDTVARYGGDEFTIILADTPLETAMRVAERIRSTVERTAFDGGRQGPLALTVCIGVGAFPEHGTSREALLGAADKAMYRAKSLGRNRVCSADDLPPGEPDPSA